MYGSNLASKGINFFQFLKDIKHSDFISLVKLYLEDQSINFLQTFQAVQLGSGNVEESTGKEILNSFLERLDYLESNKNKTTKSISRKTYTPAVKSNKSNNRETTSFNIQSAEGIDRLIASL